MSPSRLSYQQFSIPTRMMPTCLTLAMHMLASEHFHGQVMINKFHQLFEVNMFVKKSRRSTDHESWLFCLGCGKTVTLRRDRVLPNMCIGLRCDFAIANCAADAECWLLGKETKLQAEAHGAGRWFGECITHTTNQRGCIDLDTPNIPRWMTPKSLPAGFPNYDPFSP